MRAENTVYHEDEVWEYVYLDGQPGISNEGNAEIFWNVIDMYKKGSSKRNVKRSDVASTIRLVGRRGLENYFGTYFKVEGEFELGKLNLGILLLDRLRPELN